MGNSAATARKRPDAVSDSAVRPLSVAAAVAPVTLHASPSLAVAESEDTFAPLQTPVTASKKSSIPGWVVDDGPYSPLVIKAQRNSPPRLSHDVDNCTPSQALKALMSGNARFIAGESVHPNQNLVRLQKIAPKQTPIAAVLACADSRVPVELLFDQGFGDVFVCRIAGNIATAEEIASLEYAVMALNVRVIMVMGHTSCGAVMAALSGKAFPGFIDALMDHLDVAVIRAQSRNPASDLVSRHSNNGEVDPEMVDRVIRENAVYQVARCKRSAVIREAVDQGKLIVVPAVCDIQTGEVQLLQGQGRRASADMRWRQNHPDTR